MRSTLKLGHPGDTDSSPHWSFLIILLWVALTSLAAGAVLALAVNAALLILAVYAATNLLFMALVAYLARRRKASRGGGLAAERAPGVLRDRRHAGPAGPVAGASPTMHEGPSFIVLPAHARADEVARVLFSRQGYFPVVQGREVVGVVSKGRLLSALAQGQGDRLMTELMNSTVSARPVLAS